MFAFHLARLRQSQPAKKAHPLLDGLTLLVAIIGPVFTIPQIYTIWVNRNAAGVSALSWVGYTIGAAVWLAHGMVYRDRLVLVNSSLGFLLCLAVAVGALLYG